MGARGGLSRECDIAGLVTVVGRTFGSFERLADHKQALNILFAHRVDVSEKLAGLERFYGQLSKTS
jgi:hypothetical protein